MNILFWGHITSSESDVYDMPTPRLSSDCRISRALQPRVALLEKAA